MRIGILLLGDVNSDVVDRIQENLGMVFEGADFIRITETLNIPEEAFNSERRQYRSDITLSKIRWYIEKEKALDRVLGIVDVDAYVQELTSVFGEAECPGKAALISLWRLRPEFYGRSPNMELLIERGTKEAIHELGHTLGLKHCSNPFCVMYFSNSIFDTDRKQSLFCNKCHVKAEAAMEKRGVDVE